MILKPTLLHFAAHTWQPRKREGFGFKEELLLRSKIIKVVHPLFYAYRSGAIPALKYLLEQGANINAANNRGETLVFKSAQMMILR